MITQIKGLHHITSLASNAQENNDFFTQILGLRRIKKTVNFDRPEVYHLYYGDAVGTPGTVMTYFPFPGLHRGRSGTGAVGTTVFAVPVGALTYWHERLEGMGFEELTQTIRFGETRLGFRGPDGDGFALVEQKDDERSPWTGSDVDGQQAIRGFHSATLRLEDIGPTGALLQFMGFEDQGSENHQKRYRLPGGNGANIIDLQALPDVVPAEEGAGSVHHIAFAVENRHDQQNVRKALVDAGYDVTEVKDRDYFYAVYFQTPGGILFEIATNEPGFDRDETVDHLGKTLMLPRQHTHLRAKLERELPLLRD